MLQEYGAPLFTVSFSGFALITVLIDYSKAFIFLELKSINQ